MKSKHNVQISENKLVDFSKFICCKFIDERHVEYPLASKESVSQAFCIMALIMLVFVGIVGSYFFSIVTIGGVYDRLFENNDDYAPVDYGNWTTFEHFFDDGTFVFFYGIVLPLLFILFLCCFVIIPCKEWRKDLEKRKRKVESEYGNGIV